MIRANGERNGVTPSQLCVRQLSWGEAADADGASNAVGAGGRCAHLIVAAGVTTAWPPCVTAACARLRCAELIVAADVLYDWGAESSERLEATLRSLVRRGGCARVLFCWRARNFREERFLPRLADLGEVETTWREKGGPPPPASAPEEELNVWQGENMGAIAIAVLRLAA